MIRVRNKLAGLWSGIALMMVLIAVIFYSSDAAQRSRAVSHDGVRNLNLARAVAEHTGRTLSYAASMCRYLQKNHASLKGDDLTRYLAVANIGDAGIVQVALADSSGTVKWTNLGAVKTPVSIRDREHFAVHVRAGAPEIFVGKPVLGRVSKKWTIQLSCRLDDRKFRFDGVAVISLDPNYFSELYADFNLGALGQVLLIGSDGVLRARSFSSNSSATTRVDGESSGAGGIGENMRSSPIYLTSRASESGETLVASRDDRELLHAWYRVPAFDLTAHVVTDVREVLSDYYSARKWYFSYVVLICALMIGGGLLITRSALRQQKVIRIVEDAKLKAEQSDQFKSEFVTAMSHEIRGPLTNIQGFAELIATQKLDEATTRDFAETILRAVRHLLTVINTVLDAEKMTHSKLVISPQPSDLRRMLKMCLQMNEVQALGKKLELSAVVEDSVPSLLRIDELRLSQVLHNLIGNSVKFTQSGSVRVRAAVQGPMLQISVDDTGPGIAPEFQDRIFEKYMQGDPKLSRIHGGTGLGLNLSKMIVEMMHGRIYCRSVEGAGCKFVVELPLDEIVIKEVQSPGAGSSQQ